MLLVIFGAGASYDSVLHLPPPPPGYRRDPHEDSRLPLANHLFDDRGLFVAVMDQYTACKPLVNLLRGEIQVEQQLAKFEEQAKTFPPRRSQLAAIRYYLHNMLWNCQNNWQSYHHGITNYSTFLDAVERWRFTQNEHVCFVTFNYDTMLEASMQDLWGYWFKDFNTYISSPDFKLIKLHGSVDWGLCLPKVRYRAPAEVIDAAAFGVDISQEFRKVTRTPVILDDGNLGFPAIAIPVQNKRDFSCPPEHLTALADVLPKVTKIITIGWRATEQHFLKILKSPLTGLKNGLDTMIVSGSMKDAEETRNNLGLSLGPPSVLIDKGFSALIRDRLEQLEHFLW